MSNEKNYASIAVFCFNRPEHLQRTVNALAQNVLASKSHITFFCDGPRNAEEKKLTDKVRSIARNTKGFSSVSVVEQEKNMGCAASVISGLEHMFANHEELIVIEDDILCSPYTLEFLNEGLQKYKNESKIFSISASTPPPITETTPKHYPYNVYAIPRFNCWGWASWRSRFMDIDWNVTDYSEFKATIKARKAYAQGGEDLPTMLDAQMEGKIDSWAIRADYARFKKGLVSINPVISYTTNIGIGCGTHTTAYTSKHDNDITKALPVKDICWVENVQFNKTILKNYYLFYSPPPKQTQNIYKTLIKQTACCLLKKIGIYEVVKKIYKNNTI